MYQPQGPKSRTRSFFSDSRFFKSFKGVNGIDSSSKSVSAEMFGVEERVGAGKDAFVCQGA